MFEQARDPRVASEASASGTRSSEFLHFHGKLSSSERRRKSRLIEKHGGQTGRIK